MWDKLSMSEKAQLIQLGVSNGITDLGTIRDTYNQYAQGGYTDRPDLEEGLTKEYKYLAEKYPAHVIQDSTYMKDVPGSERFGNIETMLREDAWYPELDYLYRNPYPQENTIVFNEDVRDPQTAVNLDYLHVLREEDPDYNKALEAIMEIGRSPGTDFYLNAQEEYSRQLKKGVEPQSMEQLIGNEVDGWLRNMFHPGTPEELEADNYRKDRATMLFEESPWLYEPTREVYNYLHPYELDEITITPDKKAFGGRVNRFDEGGPKYESVYPIQKVFSIDNGKNVKASVDPVTFNSLISFDDVLNGNSNQLLRNYPQYTFYTDQGQVLPGVEVMGYPLRKDEYNRKENSIYKSTIDKLYDDPSFVNPYDTNYMLTHSEDRINKMIDIQKDEIKNIYNHPEYEASLIRELGYSEKEAQKFIKKLNDNVDRVTHKEDSDTRKYYEEHPSVAALYQSNWATAPEATWLTKNIKSPLNDLVGNTHFISLESDYNKDTFNENNIDYEQFQNTSDSIAHEIGHASEHNSNNSTGEIIESHNKQYPVEATAADPKYAEYLQTPTELRTRALKLRRWHQKTGRSYQDLLNDELIMNSERDLNTLRRYYDRDQLLEYLNHFVYNEPQQQNNVNDYNIAALGGKLRKIKNNQ